jgi:hypothetical protein
MVGCIIKQEDSAGSPLGVFQVQLASQLLDKEKDCASIVGAPVCSEEHPPITRDSHDQRHLAHSLTFQLQGPCLRYHPRVIAIFSLVDDTLIYIDHNLVFES